MTVSWRFDTNGEFSSPVVVLGERYSYVLHSQSEESCQYKCINGCDVGVSVITSHHDQGGWSVCSKYLANISPLHLHTCGGGNQIRDLNEALAGFDINS